MALSDTQLTRPDRGEAATRAPSVLAVVATHNGRDWLRECLIALSNQTYPALDVLVVDDASQDHRGPPTLKRIAKRHLRRRRWGYLRTPRPLGFGGAINWALGRIKTDADMLLFIHDDAVLDRRSVHRMVNRLRADDATAIVGPKIVSWEDSSRLEEVGMAADRFGYPYKGLEEGEIDLGQHDRSGEVFYVTSTCMLVRHSVFRELRGWDSKMRAFAEDLDLCWRARLAGHTVRVEPRARARHAIALARGLRRSPFRQTRYFIRRNRLRTVVKNASTLRLIGLIPQFLLLTIGEMLGFIALRQPRDVLNVTRALFWNLLQLPQTLTERARVQRRRKVSDRRLRPLTVRETTRIRSYVGHQASRLEGAWGRRADVLAQRGVQAKAAGERLMGWPGVVALGVALVILLGFRHILWAPPAAVGELLPFADRPTALWRGWSSPWQGAGLGSPGPTSPGLALLGFLPVVLLGAAGAAQKVLVLGLGVVAFIGAYNLVSELVDRPARVAAGLAYAFGAVGFAGVREGRLGAMVFGAAAPLVLGSMLRLLGWMRPPGFVPGRAVARIAIGGAVSASFVPGTLILYAITGAVLAGIRALLDPAAKAMRRLIATIIGLVAGWALLLPWSTTWFAEGGPFNRLLSDGSWRAYAASYRGHGMASVLLGQTPDGPPIFGIALPLFGLIAVLVGDGARRRLALAMWTVVAVTGLLVDAFAGGLLRPLVAAPTEAGVLAALAFAGLVGLAVGAFRLDLPRRGLGWIHALTLSVLAFAVFLVVAGIAPEMWRGGWDPGRTAGEDAETREQIAALFEAEIQQEGQFRALWVGEKWSSPEPSAIRPLGDHHLTGARGPVLGDLFERDWGDADAELDRAVASIEEGTTDRGGRLLAPFNIFFVIVEPDADAWLRQRDLALIRSEGEYLVLRNQVEVPRAAVFDSLPNYVTDVSGFDAQTVDPEFALDQRSAHLYVAQNVSGGGVAYLAEAADEGWTGELGDEPLEKVAGGWGNAFELPAAEGELRVEFPMSVRHVVWLIVIALVWVAAVGAAFPSRRSTRERVRT
jgi:GT2 family glycosyltransferase